MQKPIANDHSKYLRDFRYALLDKKANRLWLAFFLFARR